VCELKPQIHTKLTSSLLLVLADKLYMPLQSMNPQVIALFLVIFWAILPRCVHDPKFCPVCLIFLQNV
jgi:hypothetical protein